MYKLYVNQTTGEIWGLTTVNSSIPELEENSDIVIIIYDEPITFDDSIPYKLFYDFESQKIIQKPIQEVEP